MAEYITADVFRYDPEADAAPRYEEYRVESDGEMSVLSLIDRIQRDLDGTLSFRSYCCGLQMCRSCLMKIDGKKAFACITRVKPGGRVRVEPWSFPERHVKDLVVRGDGE